MAAWSFASSIGAERLSALAQPTSLAEIIERVRTCARVLCVHQRECCDLAGFSRVVATITIPPPVFDLFFNSADGYRGAYARSPYIGLEANNRILASLLPQVLAANEAQHAGLSPDFVRESLQSPSAKLWLAEIGLHLCPLCEGEWERPTDEDAEIQNGTWDHAAGVEAAWGRKAPYFTKLKLVGAFLNSRYDEFVPFHKRHRAQLLHDRGWA